MVERLPVKETVGGSSPPFPANDEEAPEGARLIEGEDKMVLFSGFDSDAEGNVIHIIRYVDGEEKIEFECKCGCKLGILYSKHGFMRKRFSSGSSSGV